ncbi:MAG: hypothetical protein EZS28_009702 [Streblomastix strix]|uniref:Uncharacterized protein n=1 Tax=Streblomastix strix TaxID=222440 RepID=A0A5J4WJ64_9EUKA|nr:MAG: hypothetical protein EZS28_009702 [Streblomastix strix]
MTNENKSPPLQIEDDITSTGIKFSQVEAKPSTSPIEEIVLPKENFNKFPTGFGLRVQITDVNKEVSRLHQMMEDEFWKKLEHERKLEMDEYQLLSLKHFEKFQASVQQEFKELCLQHQIDQDDDEDDDEDEEEDDDEEDDDEEEDEENKLKDKARKLRRKSKTR